MYLSAGHSTKDPGAVSFGRKEADIAVEFRNLVSSELSAQKIRHELDGVGPDNLPLVETVKFSKKHRTSVEFHCNASDNARATGVEILCGPKDNDIAAKLCQALATTLAIRNRGVKPENAGQHHRLAFVQAGGMIVELFFISNPTDLAAYDARKHLAAKAVAGILAKYGS